MLETDELLLRRFLQKGDEFALEELVRRHSALVLGTCQRILGNAADAQDAFQNTFIIFLKKAATIQKASSLKSWLYQAAIRAALKIRSSKYREWTSLEKTELSSEPNPDTSFAWKELRPILDEELERLGETYQMPLVLCYLEGKVGEEAAQTLGLNYNTFKVRLMRGRELLRKRLSRRGIVFSSGALAQILTLGRSEAASESLIQSTVKQAKAAWPLLIQGEPDSALFERILMTSTKKTFIGAFSIILLLLFGLIFWILSRSTPQVEPILEEKKIQMAAELPVKTRPEPGRPTNITETAAPPIKEVVSISGIVVDFQGNPAPGILLTVYRPNLTKEEKQKARYSSPMEQFTKKTEEHPIEKESTISLPDTLGPDYSYHPSSVLAPVKFDRQRNCVTLRSSSKGEFKISNLQAGESYEIFCDGNVWLDENSPGTIIQAPAEGVRVYLPNSLLHLHFTIPQEYQHLFEKINVKTSKPYPSYFINGSDLPQNRLYEVVVRPQESFDVIIQGEMLETITLANLSLQKGEWRHLEIPLKPLECNNQLIVDVADSDGHPISNVILRDVTDLSPQPVTSLSLYSRFLWNNTPSSKEITPNTGSFIMKGIKSGKRTILVQPRATTLLLPQIFTVNMPEKGEEKQRITLEKASLLRLLMTPYQAKIIRYALISRSPNDAQQFAVKFSRSSEPVNEEAPSTRNLGVYDCSTPLEPGEYMLQLYLNSGSRSRKIPFEILKKEEIVELDFSSLETFETSKDP